MLAYLPPAEQAESFAPGLYNIHHFPIIHVLGLDIYLSIKFN
jgi:hypothetical protein